MDRTTLHQRFRKNGRTDYYDYNLIAVTILLIGFGLVMLYSTSSYTAEIQFHNDMYFLKRQGIFSLIAVSAAVLVSFLDYHLLWFLSKLLYWVAFAAMFAVKFTPLGMDINGARRWLRMGFFSFQPAEIAKIAVITYLPVLIIRTGKHFRDIRELAKISLVGLFQAGCAYILTENLSTAIIIALITFAIIFIAHPKTGIFLGFIAFAVISAILIVFQITRGASSGSFRAMRVLVWLDPEKYSSSGGYQILQGLYALGSGGLFGKGLGNSTQKLGALPEAQNDMIFSIICEELGVFGGAIIVMLFIYLLYRLFFIAQNAPDLYGSLMVSGVFAHIAVQVILNICVAVNAIPTTGVTLPLISYGGTSVMFLMMELAIALSVSRRIRFRQKERDLWGELVDA